MATSKEFTNKLLISITDGKKLGEIKGLYLDPNARQVVGIFLGTEGLINRKTLAMAQSAVQVYGIDAWLIAGSDTVTTLDALPDSATFIQVSDLRGREVHTEGGTKIGVVEDVLLDSGMRVLGFTLGKVFVQGPLADRKAIARDAVTSLGGKDAPMTATMALAESQAIPPA